MFKYWLKQGVKLFTFFFNRLAISWGSNRTDHGSVSWGKNFLHSFNDLHLVWLFQQSSTSFQRSSILSAQTPLARVAKWAGDSEGIVPRQWGGRLLSGCARLSNTQWSGVALGRPTAGVGVHREGPEPREHPEEPRRLSSQRPGAWAGAEGVAGDLGLCRQDQAAFSPTDCVEGNAIEALNNMYCYHNF